MKKDRLIRLSKSCLGETEKKAVMDVLDREYLGMGAEVQQFEQALSNFFGRPAVCVVNGTAALHLALQATDVGPDDEVLVQSFTYVASFQAIAASGARPVACDVNPSTLTLDIRDAEKRVTSKTKAIMPVHYGGGVGNLNEIYAFAKDNGLRVIEDAAHAFGTCHEGKIIGGFGDVACFSFDGIKNITSGEGGCIVTDDERVLQIARDARLLSVNKDTDKRFSGQRSWEFDVTNLGWRYHMSNIMAAIGLEQIKRFKKMSTTRQLLAFRYDKWLGKHDRIKIIKHNYKEVVPHIYVVMIKGLADRNDIQKQLLDSGIQTGIHYQPNHALSYFKDSAALPLPVTDSIFPEIISLPLHPDLCEDDIDFICKKLLELVK